jgi:LPS export ABC transporter protein LptC|uniref:LPS export ABC transporter periplasmic protein LptC n=1 Tax=Desulfobacca acetoxidans TaxID=60893 RepID=A0A7C5EN20_9BACT
MGERKIWQKFGSSGPEPDKFGGSRGLGRVRRGGLLAGLALLLLLGWGLWAFLTPPPPPAPLPPQSEEKSRMEALSLTEIEQGGKRWVLDAKKAEYLKNRDEIRIEEIYLEFYGAQDEVIYLRAQEGVVNTKKRDLVLRGGVEIEKGDLTIRTEEVRYLPEERALTAPAQVLLEGPRVRIAGEDLRVELGKRRLILKKHKATELKLERGLL